MGWKGSQARKEGQSQSEMRQGFVYCRQGFIFIRQFWQGGVRVEEGGKSFEEGRIGLALAHVLAASHLQS